VILFRVFGRWPANVVLLFVAAWFLAFSGAARRASLQFLQRAIGPVATFAALARTYRHLLAFAHTLVDRVELGVDGPKKFTRVSEQGVGELLDTSVGAKGTILLTAHLGSWELASGLLSSRLKAPFDIVAYDGEEPHVRAAIERSSEKFKPNILLVGRGELAALDILRALRAGHIVALQGDRTLDERTIPVDFLGYPAHFPVGPFVVAALSGAPVVSAFNIRVAPYKYEFFAFKPATYAFERGRNKNEQLTEWVQAYVRNLEEVVRKHPLQWFNFFDFWATPPSAAEPAPASAAAPQPAPVPAAAPAPSPRAPS
jgi:predicted LPLAT superfamily acyltransferase